MYSNMEHISSVISKKSEKLRFFEPFYMVAVVGGVEKIFFDPSHYGHHVKRLKKRSFSDFFETTLEMFSILEYIEQIEILA